MQTKMNIITQQIKNSLLPCCQLYLRVKTIELKVSLDSDYAKDIESIIKIETMDAGNMMKRDLQKIYREEGIETFRSCVNYCKDFTESSFFKRTIISLFKDAKSTDPVSISLFDFIASKRHLSSVNRIRASINKVERDEFKKNLPCATISGTFFKRNIENISNYNGLVCLDFDAKDNEGKTVSEMKKILSEFEETLYAGLSVSGLGVYAIINTDNIDVKSHSKIVIRQRGSPISLQQ